MESCVDVLHWRQSTLLEHPSDLVLVESINTDRVVVHQTRRALVVKRYERLLRSGDSETEDFVRLVLTHHHQPKQILIEGNGALQVGHLNADVVDLHRF